MKDIRCHDFTLRAAKPNSVINHILNVGFIGSRGYYDDSIKKNEKETLQIKKGYR